MIVTVDPSSKDVVVVEKMKKITDSYPISSDELWSTIHKTIPDLKQTDFYKFLKEKRLKEMKNMRHIILGIKDMRKIISGLEKLQPAQLCYTTKNVYSI